MSKNYVEIVAKENEEQTLYQWDTDRKLKVLTDDDITVDEVHFSNAFTQQALIVVPMADVDLGCMVADIPNILLQYFIPIDVYVVMYSEKGERTVYTQRLEIIKRAKPSDYVYTETELLSWDMLERQIKELKENMPTKTSDLENDSGFTTQETVDKSLENYGQLELIHEVEISEEITALSISEDMNGEPFELREAIIFYYFPKYEGDTEIPTYCFAELNGLIVGDYHTRSIAYTQAYFMPDKTKATSGYWSVKQDFKSKIRTEKKVADRNYDNSFDAFSGYTGANFKEYKVINDELGTIKSIGFKYGLAFKGCKVTLYGVRA